MGPATSSVPPAGRSLVVGRVRRPSARTWLLTIAAAVAAVLAGWLGGASVRVAHAENTLVSSSPANNETVATSPTSLGFVFAEPLGPTSTIVVACNGEPFPVGVPQVGPDGLSASVAVPNPMPKGTCSAVLSVSAPDAQPNGSARITFNITADAAPTTTVAVADPATSTGDASTPTSVDGSVDGSVALDDTAGSGTGDGSDTEVDTPRVGGPLGLARLVSSLSVAVLFGSFVLIVVAWPEGIEYILTVRFLRTAWGVAIVSSVFVAILMRTIVLVGAVFVLSVVYVFVVEIFGKTIFAAWGQRGADDEVDEHKEM